MKRISDIKQLTVLILAGSLIFGCKKTIDPSSVESVSKTPKQSLSLAAANEAKETMKKFTTVYNTDYMSVGTGGLEIERYGEIKVLKKFPLSGVTKVYLYWYGISPVEEEVGRTIKFKGISITGTNIGISKLYSRTNPVNNSQAYRADVTSIVKSSSSRIFSITDFGRMTALGASLILFYSDGNSSNNRDVVLFNGNDDNSETALGFPGNSKSPVDLKGWDVFLSGLRYTSGRVIISMHGGDGDIWPDGDLFLNQQYLGFALFNGRSVPNGASILGAKWDIIPIDVTDVMSPGINPLRLQMLDFYDDQLNLVIVVFNLPVGAAPVKVIKAPFDLQTVRTSNSDGVKALSKAVIMGTPTFHVNQIDLSTVRINGIPLDQLRIRDVSAPLNDTTGNCYTCPALPVDGINDLELIVASNKLLDASQDKTYIKVTLTGKLLPQYGSTAIEAVDYLYPGI